MTEQRPSTATEQDYLRDNIATVAFHLGQPGARLSVSHPEKSGLVVEPGEVLKEVSRRLTAPAQGSRHCDKVSTALRNAALFLELGAKYAPDERISQKIEATGEMLKTRGLATVMRTVTASCAELVDSPEQDPVFAGLQSQSGINQSLPEGTLGEGVSLPSTESGSGK